MYLFEEEEVLNSIDYWGSGLIILQHQSRQLKARTYWCRHDIHLTCMIIAQVLATQGKSSGRYFTAL